MFPRNASACAMLASPPFARVTTASDAYERTSFGQYFSSSSVLAKMSAQMMRPFTATTMPTALRSRSCLIRLS